MNEEIQDCKHLLFPCWRQFWLAFVVTSESVNTTLAQNQAKLGVLVLAVTLQMLADGDCLLDHVVQILWQVWCKTFGFKHAQDFVAGYETNLSDSVRISEDDTFEAREREIQDYEQTCIILQTQPNGTYRFGKGSNPSWPTWIFAL